MTVFDLLGRPVALLLDAELSVGTHRVGWNGRHQHGVQVANGIYSKATFHRWKRKYGDMDLADAKRLKELDKENGELKKMLAESMLKIRVLEEVNSKKW